MPATPPVVALGGGHGLAATLRALRRLDVDPVAVVSVADDGGSSGRLRVGGHRTALGDLRKCLLALAEAPDGALARAMEHRFAAGELAGHSFGNLLIAALEDTQGDLVAALDEAASLLGCVGRVLPATTDVVELVARCEHRVSGQIPPGQTAVGQTVVGQTAVAATPGVRTVELRPRPTATPEALAAVRDARTIVLGPGSLYTSVLAAVVVPGLVAAIAQGGARVVYVANLRPQARETEGYSVADHVHALGRHGVVPEVVLYDPDRAGDAEGVTGATPVALAAPNGLVHDPDALAAALGPLIGVPRP